VRRARATYLKERATGEHPAQIRNRFESLRKDKAPSPRAAVTRLTTTIQDYVQANPDQHPGFEWTQFVATEQTAILYD
jgi:hypothetical protein